MADFFPTPPGMQTIPTGHQPAPGWFSPKAELLSLWTGAATGDSNSTSGARTVLWSTPIFDLRPDFFAAGRPQGTGPTQMGQQPIHRPYGTGGQLFVELMITKAETAAGAANPLHGISITANEEGHPWDPNDLRIVSSEQDVSHLLLSSNSPRRGGPGTYTGGIAAFRPLGGENPVRYWRLNLVIRNWVVMDDPTIVIAAGYY